MSVTGFYDGDVVRTDAPLQKNQRVIVIPVEEMEAFGRTAEGFLSQYASPGLIAEEKSAWRKAALEKHGK